MKRRCPHPDFGKAESVRLYRAVRTPCLTTDRRASTGRTKHADCIGLPIPVPECKLGSASEEATNEKAIRLGRLHSRR